MRSSQAEQETACLHPEVEIAMKTWLQTRSHPAFLLIGSPGVGKTTMAYRVCKQEQYWIQEFNASHTRTGSSFRQTILPLLVETGISTLIHPSTPKGRAILLDEMDGLSQGEKGGLQELLDYLKSKRNFKEDAPLFLICNVMEGRVMQQLLKHCLVHHVRMPKKDILDQFYKAPVSESLYRLGDLRKVYQGMLCNDTKEAYEQNRQDELDKNIHVAIRAAWYTLFEKWAPGDELDLETKDANLAGLLFHQNLPLYLSKAPSWPGASQGAPSQPGASQGAPSQPGASQGAPSQPGASQGAPSRPGASQGAPSRLGASQGAPFELYNTILKYIRWSDRADFWAFFHQCWNLLPLSYHLKLKYPNQILQNFPKPETIPDIHNLVYTQLLTK